MKALLSLVALLALLILLVPAALGASSPRQSKQHAERNLLSATRMLERWHVGLVDAKSGLLRQNTTARCTGQGKAVSHLYLRFRCVLSHRKTVVRVLYFAEAHNAFEVRRLGRG